MYGLLVVVHVLVALFLVIVVLLQGGRGGMAETMGGVAAQSLFGGGANMVMTKLTAGVAALFMGTCLSLAVLSSARGRSITERLPMSVNQLPAILPTTTTPASPAAPVTPTPSAPEAASTSSGASSAPTTH